MGRSAMGSKHGRTRDECILRISPKKQNTEVEATANRPRLFIHRTGKGKSFSLAKPGFYYVPRKSNSHQIRIRHSRNVEYRQCRPLARSTSRFRYRFRVSVAETDERAKFGPLLRKFGNSENWQTKRGTSCPPVARDSRITRCRIPSRSPRRLPAPSRIPPKR